jgi:hypothetical protein
MAIKGKTKTRSGGRPPARAPRFAPVPVRPPFFARTRVKIAVGFLAGIALSAFAVWIWVGLRNEHRHNAATATLAKEKSVVSSYQGTVDGVVSQVGTASGPTVSLFSQIGQPLSDLANGKLDSNLVSTVRSALKTDTSALNTIGGVNVSSEFGNKGFSVVTINYAFNSQSKMKDALALYQKVFDLMLRASSAQGKAITALAKDAQDIQTTANSLFNDGYADYSNLKTAVGINSVPQGLGPGGSGFPGGGLPGGGLPGGS